MIKLQLSASDEPRAVTLVAQTDATRVSFYRRIGLSQEEVLQTVEVVDGYATFTDARAPEKTLLTYAAVNDWYERSSGREAVLPTWWSLTRPALAGDIRLGDLTLNTIDSDGTVWTLSDIEGWWTLPDADLPNVTRGPEEDGSYVESGRYVARSLTVSGIFLPSNVNKLEVARARLVRSLNAVRKDVTLRVDETPPRRMFVRYSGKTQINTVRSSGLTEFAVEVFAGDPLKYSVDPIYQPPSGSVTNVPVVITAGTSSVGRAYPRHYDTASDNLREYGVPGAPNAVQAINFGDYETPPVFRIYGPADNPRIEIVETGMWMEFIIKLQAGEYLEVDVKEKTVLLNGAVSRRGAMSFMSHWIHIQPGVNSIRFTAQESTSESYMTMTAYSAWLG